MKLTGKTRYRISWNKKLILQVEKSYVRAGQIVSDYDWRDAKVEDLLGILKKGE